MVAITPQVGVFWVCHDYAIKKNLHSRGATPDFTKIITKVEFIYSCTHMSGVPLWTACLQALGKFSLMILPVVTVVESFLNWFSRHLKTKLKDSFNFCNWTLTILEIAKLSIKFLLKTTFKSKVQVLTLFLGVYRWEDIVPFIKQFESLGDDLTAGPGVQQWKS